MYASVLFTDPATAQTITATHTAITAAYLDVYKRQYLTNERNGVFKARLDCKRWGKKRNILVYFTFEDGRCV